MGDSAFIRRTRYRRAGCTQTCPSGSGGGGWIPLLPRGWPPTSSLGTSACAPMSIVPERAGTSLPAENDHAPLRQVDVELPVGLGPRLVVGVTRPVPAAE